MKRGQGMSINMLILVALGIAVLVISVIMLMSNSKKGNTALNDCANLGGHCVSSCTPPNCPCPEGERQNTFGKCTDNAQTCCA